MPPISCFWGIFLAYSPLVFVCYWIYREWVIIIKRDNIFIENNNQTEHIATYIKNNYFPDNKGNENEMREDKSNFGLVFDAKFNFFY